nr:MAG TPA: hypothetical protein [Caudoviricetes sp.]
MKCQATVTQSIFLLKAIVDGVMMGNGIGNTQQRAGVIRRNMVVLMIIPPMF